MGQGFSVNVGRLAAGSQDVTDLERRCQVVTGDAVGALVSMAGSTGHPGLDSALTVAVDQGAKAFFSMAAVYQHVSVGLTASAGTYTATEQIIAKAARAAVTAGAVLGEHR